MSGSDARCDDQGHGPRRPRLPLDRVGWARWRGSVQAFATSEVSGRAKAMAAALFVLLVAINGLNVVNSYVGRDFMTAIESRSMTRFTTMALIYLGVFAASTVAAVIYRFTEERLALLWRQWLTNRLVDRYLQRDMYYWIRERAAVSNPDQRIADDVRSFTATTISLALVLLNSTFTIIAFSGVMWSISPLLFGTAVGYAALGSILTVIFGRPLIWLNYTQADREASLRADLVHLRENAESVAVMHREDHLRTRIRCRIEELTSNARRIIAVNRNLGFFTTGYNYLIQIIPVLIVAPLFIRGQAEFGEIPQSAMAFAHLLGAFSLVITQFQQISGYAVVGARLSALGESTDQLAARAGTGIEFEDGAERLAWEGLSLRSPHDGSLLLESLTHAVPPGTRLLVTGANDTARTALFRATAGVWEAGDGRIERPSPPAIQFLPERPYLPPGTLREALTPGAGPHEISEDKIRAALRALDIESAVTRVGGLDQEHDWDDALSLSEQQRLSYARVLLDTARYVIIENPQPLLGTTSAARMLQLFAARGITTVTFSPNDALATEHDWVLVLEAAGHWHGRPAHEEQPVRASP